MHDKRLIYRLAMIAVLALSLAAGVASAQSPNKKPARRPAPSDAKPGDEQKPAGPADYFSTHFLLHTDLTPKEAQELLKRLETMVDLVSKYWGQPPSGVVECFVVKDLAKWDLNVLAPGLSKIKEGAGVTITETASLGGKKVLAKAVVYAVADHGTPQHEAVHAYCGQTFGTCGPLWYSEGMAEMGQYWKPNDQAVHIHPGVLKYIQSTKPQSLNEIVNSKSTTGDSWQNYAWRWALCHLLANNPNYRDRFRPLGLGFLTEQKVSFEETYGAMADEISFEYLFFLEHIDDGYRVDLCSWDWKKKFKPLVGSSPVSTKIVAGRGWQASTVTLVADKEYEFSSAGGWQIGKQAKETTADGGPQGQGRLVGAVLKSYELSKPFDLGTYGTFQAPSDGKLFLRCQDTWNELADNKGAVTVKLKLAGVGTPLSKPKEKGSESPKSDKGSKADSAKKPESAKQPEAAAN